MVLQDWLASSLLPPDDLATAAVSPSLVSVLTTAAEELVNSMASDINSLAFKVTLIKNYMDMLERHRKLESADLLLLVAGLCHGQAADLAGQDKTFQNGKTETVGSLPNAEDSAQKLVPCVTRLIEELSSAARSKVISAFSSPSNIRCSPQPGLPVTSSSIVQTPVLSSTNWSLLCSRC